MSVAIDLGYLAKGLCTDQGMRGDLLECVKQVALAWVTAGVDPAPVEVFAEILARAAANLGDGKAGFECFEPSVADLGLPESVVGFVRAALATELTATELAALAVHMVDIAEAAALQIFVPELPRLSARSERTGDAARQVGRARFLRG